MPFQKGRKLTDYSRVQRWIGKALRDRSFQYRKARAKGKEYLNVGCGANIFPQFCNLDYGWRPGIDICADIAGGIPLPSASMAGIFTEHCLEHVPFDACVAVLTDFHRLLRPGGTLRVIVPDGGLYLRLYAAADRGEKVEFPYVGKEGLEDLREDSRLGFTPMMAVNRIFRGYDHLFAYDHATLTQMLRHVGFAQVETVDYRQGRDPQLLVDSELRAPQSLFIEAYKQAS